MSGIGTSSRFVVVGGTVPSALLAIVMHTESLRSGMLVAYVVDSGDNYDVDVI